ncbi:urease accessory protein UreF [Blautia wexlerae]|nr:urease accessory protein UreF [Blautia wexlerae]
MSEKQFYLLQVNDALFPIGGYSHSQGLETYIQRGIVHNVDTAREYITHKIKWNLAYTELLATRLAYEARREKKTCRNFCTWKNFWKHPEFLWNREKLARKMGSRFAKTIEKLGLSIGETGIFREYLDARKGKAVNHCCIYGVFCAEMQIPLEEALTHYLYAQTSAIVTNCVKTIPLSQTSGQQLLSGCYGEFDEILKDVMNRSEEDLCLSAPGFDIRGIQHEKLYSRLYMS